MTHENHHSSENLDNSEFQNYKNALCLIKKNFVEITALVIRIDKFFC